MTGDGENDFVGGERGISEEPEALVVESAGGGGVKACWVNVV